MAQWAGNLPLSERVAKLFQASQGNGFPFPIFIFVFALSNMGIPLQARPTAVA
jgi:hypothetical protein